MHTIKKHQVFLNVSKILVFFKEIKIFKYMKNLTLIVLTVLSINCFSQSKNFIDQNYIEVSGKAEMEVIPNEIYLEIFLDENDFKGKEDLETLEKKMIEKMTDIGIDASKDLAVKDMVSNFKNYWIKSTEIKSTKEYELKVADAKTAGLVFKELEALGISNISINRVDHSEIQDYKQQVKVEAVKAARQKAEALVAAIDQTCGKAIFIQEQNYHVYKAMEGYAAGASNIMIRGTNSRDKSVTPDIEFEKIKLEYSILVRFELN